MPLTRGNTIPTAIKRGNTDVLKVYRGNSLVWEKDPDPFRALGVNMDGRTAPFKVMYTGSSTTQGIPPYGVTNKFFNYVSQFSARLLAYSKGGLCTQGVVSATTTSGVTAPSANGMYFFNCGLGGTDSANYIGTDRRALMDLIAPQVIIHMVGANDYRNQSPTPAVFKTNIQAVITDARTRVPGVKHVFVHSYPSLDVTGSPTYTWGTYLDKLKEIAAANSDVRVVDVSPQWAARGVYLNSPDPENLVSGDNIHATDDGHTFLSDSIITAMGLEGKLNHGRLVYAFNPDDLSVSNGTEITTIPAASGSFETVAALTGQAAGTRPTMLTAGQNGKKMLVFDGTADRLDVNFANTYGLPLTIFKVMIPLSGGTSTNPRPIWSRTTGTHAGFLYGWGFKDTAMSTIAEHMRVSNFGTVAVDNYAHYYNEPYVYGVTNHPLRGYIFQTGKRLEWASTSVTDSALSPFISSLRLGSNTGAAAWNNMRVGQTRIYQGLLSDAEVAVVLDELGAYYNIPITPGWGRTITGVGAPTLVEDMVGGGGADLTTRGWVDRMNNGTMQVGNNASASVVGATAYRAFSAYYKNTDLPDAVNQWATLRVRMGPISAISTSAGMGLVLRHNDTNGVFFKVTQAGQWRIYHGASNSTTTTDPSSGTSFIASGTMPRRLRNCDELTAVAFGNQFKLYLNNDYIGGGTNANAPTGTRAGIVGSCNNSGESRFWEAGVATSI